jgi:hypothetical protein
MWKYGFPSDYYSLVIWFQCHSLILSYIFPMTVTFDIITDGYFTKTCFG